MFEDIRRIVILLFLCVTLVMFDPSGVAIILLFLCVTIIHIWRVCVAIIHTWGGGSSMYERITSIVMMLLFLIVIFYIAIVPPLNFLNVWATYIFVFSTIISIPSFVFLRKRNYLFWWDCMIPYYGFNLWLFLVIVHEPPGYTFSSPVVPIYLIAAFSVVLNYIKMLAIRLEAVKKFSPMQISIASIVMMLLFTLLIYLVVPLSYS